MNPIVAAVCVFVACLFAATSSGIWGRIEQWHVWALILSVGGIAVSVLYVFGLPSFR